MVSAEFRYKSVESIVPIYAPLDTKKPSIHRFYDTSAISPSGRFLAVTEFTSDTSMPKHGDYANVCIIELSSGEYIYRTLTQAWDTQVGAHVQWGATDDDLFFNRMNTENWSPYAVKYSLSTDSEKAYTGSVYFVKNSGEHFISPCLNRINRVQPGYGTHIPPSSRKYNVGFPKDDGLYVTSTESKKTHLLLSFYDIYTALEKDFKELDLENGGCYGFHAKYSPDDKKIMFILRWMPNGSAEGRSRTKNYLITFNADGSDICLVVSPSEWAGGHHPTWCPDSNSVIMNLISPRKNVYLTKAVRALEKIAQKLGQRFFVPQFALKFVKITADGIHKETLAPSHIGSGHPTMDPSQRFIITDAYPSEVLSKDGRHVPIRVIDTLKNKSENLVQIDVLPEYSGSNQEWRVDPHPAWSKCGRWLIFNGCHQGCRTVFLADFDSYIKG
ncbi:hypothetical protein M0220_13335 [Halomonas qinghailakensis]|uniref:Uncharacterized protein n=1 Tax=Halomonas qinghailakensis TaxID=2937790 RepID=A0AA46YPN6_9GAMM|nr:hypothetical protein [Halomonas sp. ZZQ-149]UYO73853.1 hypothetical protein M0220_13335 [Halomonas sp. ZZQ-149]